MRIADVWEQERLAAADAEVLLTRLLGRERTWILAHADDEVPGEVVQQLQKWIARRRAGEPVAYITGEKEFFGRVFSVDRCVLIPRPATEGLLAAALRYIDAPGAPMLLQPLAPGIVAFGQRWRAQQCRLVADIGTGSGCIAVTLVCERPGLHVFATDVSAKVLEVAQVNAQRYQVHDHISFRKGYLLDPLHDLSEPFLLVANPPYVTDHYDVPVDVTYEPHDAVFAGPRGLDVLRPLLHQARAHPACVGFVVECREDQIPALQAAIPQ